jgi:hypothetical protein
MPFSSDFTTSAVPGWHIIIFSLHLIGKLTVIVVLLLVTAGYWLLCRHTGKINRAVFAIHFALTILTIIYLQFPAILLNVQANPSELIQAIEFRMDLIPIAWMLLAAAQILFLLYYIRIMKARRTVPKATGNLIQRI